MERVLGWEAKLAAAVNAHTSRPFAWGSSDCATFAADCVQAITGRDVLGPLRGSYASRLAARARLRARGWRSLREATAATLAPLGAVAIDPRGARVGDVGITADGVLCIRVASGFAARDDKGRLLQASGIEIAWAIG